MDFLKRRFYYDPKSKTTKPLTHNKTHFLRIKSLISRIWNRVDEGKAPRQERHTQIYKDSSLIFFFFNVGEQQQIRWQNLLKSANFQNPVLGSSLAQTLLFCWYIFELDFVTKKGISLFKGKIWVNFDKNSDFTKTTIRCAWKYRIFTEQHIGGKNWRLYLKNTF